MTTDNTENALRSGWHVINDVARRLETDLRDLRRRIEGNAARLDHQGELHAALRSDHGAAAHALADLELRVDAIEARLQQRGILPPLWRALVKAVRR